MLAEYGIYLNCHISGVEEREVASKEEAEHLADNIEKEIAKAHPEADDVWVQLEALYE